ncbi:LexA-binding, inner membrane-associated putative hydrolase [Saccharopolyspora antimicrobica]|uniref:LexA-binding, inner membrane-associated putative hydrolase n=1 Tax=Saccharopolyspora antimicrobica TaxID=455193 RepID=A0A1I5HJD8_9PSEU|nr:metal-dependent hydrolase [Saccharopolyspora antimicrobica]RKT85260.1 LexA-binding, inner membrane-associated putative hydrolase [Saccharopolyspora antimicrobica]SFO48385.1 LexA-binding, inner membrane-associated putative hydrolase [Saccharopolyspora antimicrobica]
MATGPTHAMSGLAAWAAVTALADSHALGQLSPKTWVVGATLASGAALLPDIDHPKSTVASTFGAISRGASAGISGFSGFLYRLTRTKRDSDREGTHRGFTHTVVFAVLAGLITTAIVQTSESAAVAILMFFFAGLAVRGIMHTWSSSSDAILITVASLLLTVACWAWAGDQPTNPAAFGVAVMIGCIAHFIGDAITEQGCPMLWPVPLGGKTWYPVAPPKPMRMRTGGKVEMALIGPGLTIAAVVLSSVVLYRIGAAPWLAQLDLPPEVMAWINL